MVGQSEPRPFARDDPLALDEPAAPVGDVVQGNVLRIVYVASRPSTTGEPTRLESRSVPR